MKPLLPAIALAILLPPQASSAQMPLFTHRGQAGENLGAAAAAAGDVNRDGVADYLIGIPHRHRHDGVVEVRSGKDASLIHMLRGPSASAGIFGAATASAGDVDGDGFADILVGAPELTVNGRYSGAVFVFSGRHAKLLYTLAGDGPGDNLGLTVAGVGDVDGDGRDDFMAGAPENGDPPKNFGKGYARLYSGRTGKTLRTFFGQATGNEYGSSLAPAGDVDRDGVPDVMVGSLLELGPNGAQGSARVYSGKTGRVIHAWFAETGTDHFGMSLAKVGDLDGDGQEDLVVGSINMFSLGVKGAVWIFSGRTGKTIRVVRGSPSSGIFGWLVADAGDLDADGKTEILVADPGDRLMGKAVGSVKVLSGKDGKLLATFFSGRPESRFGWAMQPIGDVTGDGFGEIVVGSFTDDVRGANAGATALWTLRSVARVGDGCDPRHPVRLDASAASLTRPLTLFLATGLPARMGVLLGSLAPELPLRIGTGCSAFLDPASATALGMLRTGAAGRWSRSVALPRDPRLIGSRFALQVLLAPLRGPRTILSSNGVYLRVDR